MAKFSSIFKMIGCQSSRLKTVDDAIQYIFNKEKSDPSLWNEQYLDIDSPVAAWKTHPMHNTTMERKFIHALLCPYGNHIPSQSDMKIIVKELFKIFDEYPLLTAIHTDHFKSPHIHMLIQPRNILTNKVWQQTPQDLKEQKRSLTVILESLGLYGIGQHKHLNQSTSDVARAPNPDSSITTIYDNSCTASPSTIETHYIKSYDETSLNSSQVLLNLFAKPPNLVIYDSIENGFDSMDITIMEDQKYVQRIK